MPEAHYEELTLVDGLTMKAVGSVQFKLRCGNYKSEIMARVFPNLSKELILGMPWLVKENPSIDWTAGRVQLQHGETVFTLPTVMRRRQEPAIEEVNFCDSKQLSQWMRKRAVSGVYLAFDMGTGHCLDLWGYSYPMAVAEH